MGQLTHLLAVIHRLSPPMTDNPQMEDVDSALASAQAALAEGRWADARTAYEQVLTDGETPEALDGMAHALHWLGEYGRAIEVRERAYAAFLGRGETRYAAQIAAYWLAFEYAALYGNAAAAAGWLARGRRLVADEGDCPERGWVALATALAARDAVEKEQAVAEAREIAKRFGDSDLEFDALAYSGVCKVDRGQVTEGMRQLDEAAAAASNGEVGSLAVAGEIYCKMLLACELALDVRRAAQWTAVAGALARRSNVVWAAAICRMHYGGILVAAGRWAEAEDALRMSARDYDASFPALRSGALARLADLRVKQGRLEEAAELLAGNEADTYAIRPRAALELARGDAALAATLLRRYVNEHGDGFAHTATLALMAEVLVDAGQVAEARAVSAKLHGLAETVALAQVRGISEFASALVADADDRKRIARLESALAGFVVADLPFEEARTRLALARALAPHEHDIAVSEARTAAAIFARLGASLGADAAAALLRKLGAAARTGPKNLGVLSEREQEVLRLVALGLSNPEIARRLFITRKTAAHHVSNVLIKLGLRNRAQAAAYAVEAKEQSHAGGLGSTATRGGASRSSRLPPR